MDNKAQEAIDALSMIEYHHNQVSEHALRGYIDIIRSALQSHGNKNSVVNLIEKIEAEKMEHNTKLKIIEGTGRISITNAALDKAISIIREEWEL